MQRTLFRFAERYGDREWQLVIIYWTGVTRVVHRVPVTAKKHRFSSEIARWRNTYARP